jgi:hypothetical protein
MTCVECGAVADEGADGWRGYRTDLAESADDDTVPAVMVYCPECAEREFGAEPCD